jgi:hypothetical protein
VGLPGDCSSLSLFPSATLSGISHSTHHSVADTSARQHASPARSISMFCDLQIYRIPDRLQNSLLFKKVSRALRNRIRSNFRIYVFPISLILKRVESLYIWAAAIR